MTGLPIDGNTFEALLKDSTMLIELALIIVGTGAILIAVRKLIHRLKNHQAGLAPPNYLVVESRIFQIAIIVIGIIVVLLRLKYRGYL